MGWSDSPLSYSLASHAPRDSPLTKILCRPWSSSRRRRVAKMADARRSVGRPGHPRQVLGVQALAARRHDQAPRLLRRHQGFQRSDQRHRLGQGPASARCDHRGRSIPAGGSVEHKLGKRASWDWPRLIAERDRFQGLADRGEPLEAVEVDTFATYAQGWLDRKKPVLKGYGVTKGHVVSALNPTPGRKALDVHHRGGREPAGLESRAPR